MSEPKIIAVIQDGTLVVTEVEGSADIVVVDTEESVFDAVSTDLQEQIDAIELVNDGQLMAENNLDDLDDLPTALVNLGLDAVDNTADADKPISDDTQTALDLKLDANISALTAGTPVSGDLFAFRTVAGTWKKITLADLMTVINA